VTTLFKDTFTGADASLDGRTPEKEFVDGTPTWTSRGLSSPGMSIVSNRIEVDSVSGNRSQYTLESGTADGHISCTVQTSATSSERAGLCFRQVDGNNNLQARLHYNGSNNILVVQKVEAGGFTAIASGITTAGDDNTPCELKVVLSGNDITVYVDDVEEWSGTEATFNTATKHGIYIENATSAVYVDDFLMTDDGVEQDPPSVFNDEWVGQMAVGVIDAVTGGGNPGGGITVPESNAYKIGFNMNDERYFQSGNAYKNIAKFPTFYQPIGGAATFGADGYPDSGATSIRINTWGDQKLPAGTYEISHSGSGDRDGDTFVIAADQVFVILNFNGEIGPDLDIRLQGTTDTPHEYTATFADRARKASCIRFMDMLRINVGVFDSAAPTVRQETGANNEFTHHVISADEIGDMALEFRFDPWVCVHHLMTDADITTFAAALAAKLSGTGIKVYCEYSNEAWNGQFPVTQYIDNLVGNTNGQNNGGRSGFYADRADRVAELFKAEFAPGEVVGVLASQLPGTGLLNGMYSNATRDMTFVDVAAVASYMGGRWSRLNESTIGSMTLDEIDAAVRDNFENEVKQQLLTWDANAKARGLDGVITYEGGTHLETISPNTYETAQNKLYEYNNSALAGVLYDDWLDWYQNAIGSLNVIYMDVSTGGGKAWGHREYELSPTTPRWDAIINRMGNFPPTERWLTFDGTDDVVDLGGATEFQFSDGASADEPFSVAAWIRPTDATLFRIACKEDTTDWEWLLSLDSSDKLTLTLYGGGGTSVRLGKLSAALTARENTWIHVAATYDGSGLIGGINIYVDGALDNDSTDEAGSYTYMDNTTALLRMGADTTDFADGDIGELMVFNQELTAAQVGQVYSDAVGRPTPYAHWKNQKGEGTTVTDLQGNHDGTISGATWNG